MLKENIYNGLRQSILVEYYIMILIAYQYTVLTFKRLPVKII